MPKQAEVDALVGRWQNVKTGAVYVFAFGHPSIFADGGARIKLQHVGTGRHHWVDLGRLRRRYRRL